MKQFRNRGINMTKKRKIQIHIAAVLVVVCLIGWIVMLYTERHREEKSWENQFLTRYHGALNDLAHHLGQFEEAKSFEDQFSCLETITNDLMQLKAFMEMHINLVGISMPESMTSGVDPSGWREAEMIVGLINNGGTVNSYQIESFWADGAISEWEAAVIQLLKEETEKLYIDMAVPAENGNYKYVLSSVEVYQRLAEIMQNVRRQWHSNR